MSSFYDALSAIGKFLLGKQDIYQEVKIDPSPPVPVLHFNPEHDPHSGQFAHKGEGATADTGTVHDLGHIEKTGEGGEGDLYANRPTLPHERKEGAAPEPKPWVDPPPKLGKKGVGKIKRPKGEDSQTASGNLGEGASAALGFRNILPEGKRNFTAAEVKKNGSSIDVEFDHSGRLYEVKLCLTTSTEYRLKCKKKEKDDKLKYAKKMQAEAWTMIGVLDKSNRTIHYYVPKKPGLVGAEVNKKTFDFVGKVTY